MKTIVNIPVEIIEKALIEATETGSASVCVNKDGDYYVSDTNDLKEKCLVVVHFFADNMPEELYDKNEEPKDGVLFDDVFENIVGVDQYVD